MFAKASVKRSEGDQNDKIMKFMKWLWLATLVTAFFGPLLAANAHPGIFAFKILFFLHLLLFCFFLTIRKLNFNTSPQMKPYFIFFLVWLSWALLSLLWADNIQDGFQNLWYLFSGLCLIGFSIFYFRAEKDLKILLYTLVAIFIIIISVGIWEHQTGLHLKTAGFIFEAGVISKIPRGVFKNPNDLATYLALYLPFLIISAKYLLGRFKTALPALGLLACAGTGFFLIVNAGSRANLIAVALILLATVIVYLIQGKWRAFRNVLALITALAVLGLVLTSIYPRLDYQIKRQYRIARHHLLSLEHAGGENSARMILMKNALVELNQHSLMGVGPGNAEEHLKKYQTDTFLLLALHNWWLEILVNYGIFVFVLYIAFFCKLLVQLYVVATRAGPGVPKILAESALVALVGFPVAAVSSSSLVYSRVMWIFFGIALCAVNLYNINAIHCDPKKGE